MQTGHQFGILYYITSTAKLQSLPNFSQKNVSTDCVESWSPRALSPPRPKGPEPFLFLRFRGLELEDEGLFGSLGPQRASGPVMSETEFMAPGVSHHFVAGVFFPVYERSSGAFLERSRN